VEEVAVALLKERYGIEDLSREEKLYRYPAIWVYLPMV
jgi:hypothetical protein